MKNSMVEAPRVAIIGTAGIPGCYGGFETLAENLVDDQSTLSFTVYCSSKLYQEKKAEIRGAKLVYLNLNANGVQSVLYDVFSMVHALSKGATHLLVLGVSGAVILPFIRAFSRVKVVTNIDGIEWRRSKWRGLAKRFLRFSERIAVKYSHVVISDNDSIAEYVNETYGKESRVIAYGGDHAVCNVQKADDEHFCLAVCRIEPENNVELILEAFSRLKLDLVFIGNWNASEYGRTLKLRFSKFNNLQLIGPIYDMQTLASYRRSCSVYIHGHSAGGTNPSLVEAMHFGMPILCFDCNFNRATTEGKAVYFRSSNHLEELMSNKASVLIDVGRQMAEIANRRYTWAIVRRQYLEALVFG